MFVLEMWHKKLAASLAMWWLVGVIAWYGYLDLTKVLEMAVVWSGWWWYWWKQGEMKQVGIWGLLTLGNPGWWLYFDLAIGESVMLGLMCWAWVWLKLVKKPEWMKWWWSAVLGMSLFEWHMQELWSWSEAYWVFYGALVALLGYGLITALLRRLKWWWILLAVLGLFEWGHWGDWVVRVWVLGGIGFVSELLAYGAVSWRNEFLKAVVLLGYGLLMSWELLVRILPLIL